MFLLLEHARRVIKGLAPADVMLPCKDLQTKELRVDR